MRAGLFFGRPSDLPVTGAAGRHGKCHGRMNVLIRFIQKPILDLYLIERNSEYFFLHSNVPVLHEFQATFHRNSSERIVARARAVGMNNTPAIVTRTSSLSV